MENSQILLFLQNNSIYIYIIIAVAFVFILTLYFLIRRGNKEKYYSETKRLEIKKTSITNIPIPLELSRISMVVKNEELLQNYQEWQDKWRKIITVDLTEITDSILAIDEKIDFYDLKNIDDDIEKVDKHINSIILVTEDLLAEIVDYGKRDESKRLKMSDLKDRIRHLKKFNREHDEELDFATDSLENKMLEMEELITEFDNVISINNYEEAELITNSLEKNIDNLEIYFQEVVSVMKMIKSTVPTKLNELENRYNSLVEKGFSFDYLNFEYNFNESQKTLENIINRVSSLDIQDAKVELVALIEYCDRVMNEFEYEYTARDECYQIISSIETQIDSLSVDVTKILAETAENEDYYEGVDFEKIESLTKEFDIINNDYNSILEDFENKKISFTDSKDSLGSISEVIYAFEIEFKKLNYGLESIREDESRAHEQLSEINKLMNESKLRIKSIKIPTVPPYYYVELEEANEAIKEVNIELDRKPIKIDILNIRVGTARDLTLKLFNTTNQMLKNALLAEQAIVYGNRYRSSNQAIDQDLSVAEKLFMKGKYTDSLETAIESIETVEVGVYKKLLELFEPKK